MKIAYFLYDNRSGSTLLASLLNQYKGVTVSLESGFTSRLFENKNTILRNSNVSHIISFLEKETQFIECGGDKKVLFEELNNLNSFTLKSIIDSIHKSLNNDNTEVLIIKSAPYNHIQELTELYPNIQFIHILRDGRAVYNSKKKSKSLSGEFMQNNPLLVAYDWKMKLKKVERYTNILTVKYEDLVLNTDETLETILKYLTLSEAGQKRIKSQSDYAQKIGKMQKNLHTNVFALPDSKKINEWQNSLTKNEIAIFEYVNKNELKKYYSITQNANNNIVLLVKYAIPLLRTKFNNILKLLFKNNTLLKQKIYRRIKMIS